MTLGSGSLLSLFENERIFLSLFQRDMSRRDQRIDHLQTELHVQEGLTKTLKTQIKDLNDRFRVVDETGVRIIFV